MSVPLILCICPIPDDSPFGDRALTCWRAQSCGLTKFQYLPNKRGERTTGELRNQCIALGDADEQCDFIAHFDHDDISTPDRLQRQLEHIQRTGKLVTGFYDMPMYDARKDKVWIYRNDKTNYALGTSLFYRREAWERVKFPDKTPEDNIWRHRVGLENCESQSVFREDGTPMMVQVVHGGNASARIFAGTPRFKEASAEQEKAVRALIASA